LDPPLAIADARNCFDQHEITPFHRLVNVHVISNFNLSQFSACLLVALVTPVLALTVNGTVENHLTARAALQASYLQFLGCLSTAVADQASSSSAVKENTNLFNLTGAQI
jgi:hypothetical protein